MASIGRSTHDPETVRVVGKLVAQMGDKYMVEIPLKMLLTAVHLFEQQDMTRSEANR